MNMNDSIFQIGAEGVDTAKIVEEIRASVAEKRESGCYSDADIARAELVNMANFKDNENGLALYLECLREAVFVDISDFEIAERRAGVKKALIALKRIIWKLLKFYTYRLWSQQNQANGFLLSAIEHIESKYHEKMKELDRKIAVLDKEIRHQRSATTNTSAPKESETTEADGTC